MYIYSKEYRKLLPLFLRRNEVLTQEDKSLIRELYCQIGKNNLDNILKKEKQKRPYASQTLALLDCDKDYWSKVHQEYCDRNSAVLEFVKEISKDFYEAGGKSLCILENYGTLLSSKMSIGCFGSGDVDFTINQNEADLAVKIFNKHGFFVTEREGQTFAPERLESQFYNPRVLNGKGFWINILWKPIIRNFMVVQRKYTNRFEDTKINGTVRYKDTEVRLLEPTAMVYFNALHQSCEHHYGASPDMALCCDIDRVASSNVIDWDKIVRWSKEDNAGIRVQMALDISKYFLKTDIPDNLFGKKTYWYKKLWKRLIDEEHYSFISPEGKWARLVTELLSDNVPVTYALLSRLWRR